jgi:hypothetical protein
MEHISKHWNVMRGEIQRNKTIGHIWNAYTGILGGSLLAAYVAVSWPMFYAFTPWRARIVSGLLVAILLLLFLARSWRTNCDDLLRRVPITSRLTAYIFEGENLEKEVKHLKWTYDDELFKFRLDNWNHGANNMLLDIGGKEFRKRFYEGLTSTEKPEKSNEVELWVHDRTVALKDIMREIMPS